MMELIEIIFGGPPLYADTLEAAEMPRFEFVIEQVGDKDRFQLWINDEKVSLPGQEDIHQLLKEFCDHPQKKIRGSQAKEQLGVTFGIAEKWNSFRVRFAMTSRPQGSPASRATLGFGVQRLRRNEYRPRTVGPFDVPFPHNVPGSPTESNR